jgi:hypothetical protein
LFRVQLSNEKIRQSAAIYPSSQASGEIGRERMHNHGTTDSTTDLETKAAAVPAFYNLD